METTTLPLSGFLETVVGFKALSVAQRAAIATQMQPLRYPLACIIHEVHEELQVLPKSEK
jgi:hypothetical protein